jgi:hypothetical protein
LIARQIALQIGRDKTVEKLEAPNYAPCGKLSHVGRRLEPVVGPVIDFRLKEEAAGAGVRLPGQFSVFAARRVQKKTGQSWVG